MTKAQLTEKRNKLIADATALMSADTVTAETRTKFDAHMADVAAIDGDIARMEAVEKRSAEMRSAITPPRPDPSESNDPVERAEVRDARVKASFRNYLATGVVETRDLSTAGTGVIVPQLFSPQIHEAQKSYGELFNIVSVLNTDNGNPMKIVLDNDTGNGLVAVTVGTDASEVDPSLSGATLQVDNFTTGVIKIDNGLLTDAGFDVEAFVRDKFAKRYFRGISGLIYSGDSGAVASLATAYASTGFTSASTGALTYPDFATAIATLDPAYQANAVWAMSNAALGYVAGMVDGNGRPLFLPMLDGGASGFIGTILGRPVKLVTQMPTVATGNVAVLFGDFKEAYTVRVQNPGLGILRLNERYAAGFQTGFVGFARLGGIATDAGTHPVIGITIK